MTREQIAVRLAFAGAVLAAGLAATWAILAPAKLGMALFGGLLLPVLWGGMEMVTRGDKANARHAVAIAAMVLVVALGLKVAQSAQWLDADEGQFGQRLVGIMGGLVVAWLGNRIPKMLERFDPQLDHERRQAFQRHAGWVMVLSGLGSGLAWTVLPIGAAVLWGTLIVGGGVALVLARLVQCHRRGSKA